MEFQGSYLQATTVLTKVKKIAIGISLSTEVLAKKCLHGSPFLVTQCIVAFLKAMVKKIQTHFFLQRVKEFFWHLDYVFILLIFSQHFRTLCP